MTTPSTPRPPLPDKFLFSGSNVHGKAIPESLVFREPNAKGNVSMALTFLLEPDQKIEVYSAPSKELAEKYTSLAPYVGLRPGDVTKTGENFRVVWIQVISPNTFDKVIKGLKNTGWKGNRFASLDAAVKAYIEAGAAGALPEDLGSTVSRLQLQINEVDDRTSSWRMRKLESGMEVFDPQMEVAWVNSIATYFAFKDKASTNQLSALDSLLFGGGSNTSTGTPNGGKPPIDEDEIAF